MILATLKLSSSTCNSIIFGTILTHAIHRDVTATPIGEVTYNVNDMVMRQPDDETIVDPDDVIVSFTSTKLEIEGKSAS